MEKFNNNDVEAMILETAESIKESIMLSYKKGYEDGTRDIKNDLRNHKDTRKLLDNFAHFMKDYKFVMDANGEKHYSCQDYIYTSSQLVKTFLLMYGY